MTILNYFKKDLYLLNLKSSISLLAFTFLLTLFAFIQNSQAQTCTSGGDQTTYGSGNWIGYVYDHDGIGNPITNPFNTYKGFTTESAIFDRNWVNSNPSCAAGINNFAVRYKMNYTFLPGMYTFAVGADDGVRFSIDGGATWLIGVWGNHSYSISSTTIAMSGNYNLVIEYYENVGAARVSFNMSTVLKSCSGSFMDTGGSGTDYANNEDYIVTYYPTNPCEKVRLTFSSFNTQNNVDGLLIYNRNSILAPLFNSGLGAGTNPATCPSGSWRGTTSPGTITSTANDGSLTIRFSSDNSVVSSGWNAAVTCFSPAASTAPTTITGGVNACHGSTPTLVASGGIAGIESDIYWQEGPCNTAFEQNWSDQPYFAGNTIVNSVNGILNIKSTTGTQSRFEMPALGSFNPNIYKFINIRYRVVSGTPTEVALSWFNTLYTVSNPNQRKTAPLISDGNWHIMNIDMTTAVGTGNWLHSNVKGWRFDYTNVAGVIMELDFISLDEFPVLAKGTYTLPPVTQNKTYYANRRSDCGSTSCISTTITVPTKSNNLAASGETATCKVSGSNWVDFYETTTGDLIGSVNANGGDLGDVTLTAGINSGGSMFACNTGNNPLYETAYMARNWHVTSSAYPSSANFPANASIRLPYSNGELTSMNTIASGTTTGNPQDNNATAAEIMLTKISSGSIDGNPTNDCSATILGIQQSTFGTIASAYSGLTIPGNYAAFSVAQFSEMFLHKNFNTSPLPVTLTNFSATCENNVTLSWTTASERNSDRFIVEKSRDGQAWNLVGEQIAAGNSNATLNYNFTDENSWNATSYYRLRQIDFNGAEEIYGPISTSCGAAESSMIVYPNPNNGSFTIEIASTEMYNDAQLFLTDLTGKVISSQKVNVANGTTQILINDLDLKMGTYLVTLRGTEKQLKPVKITVSL